VPSLTSASGASPAPAARLPAGTRSVVEYALARRSTLVDLFAGRVSAVDVCDAHPYLLRAARFHGTPTDRPCPVCRRGPLTEVTYTYGDCFRADTNGRVRNPAELPALAREHPDFTVYVVEVCQDCSWNHLTVSYVLGVGTARTSTARTARGTTGQPAQGPPVRASTRRTAEE
jgi:uncharacterized protein DUF5318